MIVLICFDFFGVFRVVAAGMGILAHFWEVEHPEVHLVCSFLDGDEVDFIFQKLMIRAQTLPLFTVYLLIPFVRNRPYLWFFGLALRFPLIISLLLFCPYLIPFGFKFAIFSNTFQQNHLFFFALQLPFLFEFQFIPSMYGIFGRRCRLTCFLINNKIWLPSDFFLDKISHHWWKLFHFFFLELLFGVMRVGIVIGYLNFLFFLLFWTFLLEFFYLFE